MTVAKEREVQILGNADNQNENDLSISLGLLKRQLNQSGVDDFEEVADALYKHKQLQIKAGFYSQDKFTLSGSHSEAQLVCPSTGKTKDCIIWCINHYTGLNRSQKVIDSVCETVRKFGTGSGTSAISGGMCSLHKEAERRIASLVGKESALLFPTGYTTNLGVISSLPGINDFLLFDREAHASIIDGVRLSGRKFASFKHNSVEDLESKLKKYRDSYKNLFVIVESAYSMSGDVAPLKEIVELKKKYNFHLYVDEAHTFGFYGEKGAGYCNELGVTREVDFIMSTLSKSTASIGGFVACKSKYLPMIEWSTNSFLFQACLTPGDAAAILASLDELALHPELIASLHEKNRYMRKKLTQMGFDLGESQSPIIPLFIPDPETLINFNRDLYAQGVFSIAIVYPIVKPSEGRIRFILNTSHSYESIDKTVNILCELGIKYGII